MKPNPGGQSGDYAHDVVGRDQLALDCWRLLEGKSIVLSSDRREGKTWFLKKMGAECPGNVIWLFCEAEGAASVGQLLDCIYETAKRHLHFKSKIFAATLDLLEKILGKNVGTFSIPAVEDVWKKALAAIFNDLCVHADGRRVVLVIDEFPYLVHKLTRRDAAQAMEVLDVLRSLRHTHDANLRMIFAGSVGLHLVLADLKDRGYRNEPVNDMELKTVPPLDSDSAFLLTRRLLAGAGLRQDDEALIQALGKHSGAIPYYMHRLAFEMEKSNDTDWSAEQVGKLLQNLIESAEDPLNLSHYRDRIHSYYPEDDQEVLFCLLDVLAEKEGTVPVADLIKTVHQTHPPTLPTRLGLLVELLEKDHYLCRDGTDVSFASPIVRSWWIYRRVGTVAVKLSTQ